MRAMAYAAVVLACLGVGCSVRMSELEIPDREAIYDRPLEEMWPEVRHFFTENGLPFREDKGSMVLQTEWRQEFGGSKVSGYFHRYLVLGKRESPTQSKLWIIRITKSQNKTLAIPGSELSWGVSRALAPTGDQLTLSPEDMEAYFDEPQGENSFVAESGQGARDLLMEWRVFRHVAPKLAKEENAPKPIQVAKAPNVKEAPNAMGIECGLPIIGLGKQAKKGGVLLLGEMHGTQEVPRFVAQTACQAMVAGMPVTVGLELPLENQTRVDTFLESAGTEEDWLKLMEAP
ncbi:hypothetical protein ACLESO_57465, partial [Pyxidicoccus sp. 3LG]